MTAPDGPLTCPRCGRSHPAEARLCEDCSMPLTHADRPEQEPLGPAHEQARKIHPRYARGELVRVTVAGNLAEAELIKGVLLEQGIPSLIRRTAGFDVPDFLAAGPRDVLVPERGVEEARSLLLDVDAGHTALGTLPPDWEDQAGAAAEAEGGDGEPAGGPGRSRSWEFRIAAGLLAGLLAFGAVVGVIWGLILR